jgi:hypothetical protein
MDWDWFVRRWKILALSPLLLYVFSVPVSVVFMVLRDFHMAVSVVLNASVESQVLGGILTFLYLILGALNKPLGGVPRVPWWVLALAPAPYTAGLACVDLLSAFAERGVFFMPVMTEAYVATVLTYLGIAGTSTLAVLAGLYMYGALVGIRRGKGKETTSTRPRKKHNSFILNTAIIYGAGIADAVLVRIPWARVLFVVLLVLYTLFITMPLVMRKKTWFNTVRRAVMTSFLTAMVGIVIALMVVLIIADINFVAPDIGTAITAVMSAKSGASLITLLPAGIEYRGPPTAALAGYYCIRSINSSNGYSIQLNALLNNGMWVQNGYALMPVNNSWKPTIIDVVFAGTLAIHVKELPLSASCAWLLITVKDGYIYFGYGLDGRNVMWFDKYPALGAKYIVWGSHTNIALAGYGDGSTAWLGNGTLVYLALYYWNGNWTPAPVTILRSHGGTAESVSSAYVYTSGLCGGAVSWTSPMIKTTCPTPPAIKP